MPIYDRSSDDEEGDELHPFHSMWLEGDSLAPPCQSDRDIVQAIVDLLEPLHDSDVLYDLGCGDGRICIAAAERFNCVAKGVEIEPPLVEKFKKEIASRGLQNRVHAIQGDLMDQSLEDATVVITYLLPEALLALATKLEGVLQRGAVLICNTWGLKHLRPCRRIEAGPYGNVTLLVYTQKCLLPYP